MEQQQCDSIREVKAEADEFELETNRSTPSGDAEPMDATVDMDESEISVVSVKAESEKDVTKNGGGNKATTSAETSSAGPQIDDQFAPLKNNSAAEDEDQVIDLSKKVGATSSDETSSSNTPADIKETKEEKADPWPVMLTPAGPPAFPSAFPVFPGMTSPPVGYMMHPNNLQDIDNYDTYLAETRQRGMKDAKETNKTSLRRGRSQKNKLVVVTTKPEKVENPKSGRRKNATPKKKASVDTEDVVKYQKKAATTLKCRHCEKSFKTSADLEKHEKSHTKYPCDSCEEAFGSKAALKQHSLVHGRDLSYECHYCNKVFIGKRRYDIHIQTHGDETPYKCIMCQEGFVDWRSLNSHEKMHERPYKCMDCDDVFEELRALKKHSRQHTDPKAPTGDPAIFKCLQGECGQEFQKKNQLKRHTKEVHPAEYLCKHCGKTLKDKSTFEKHERRHLGEKHFMCKFCGKMFIDQASCNRHERVHTGEKPFKCKICEKGFSTSSACNVHVRTHTGETPFPCKICGKKFSSAGSVYLHLRIHSDVRDYKCEVEGCGKAFRQKAALQMHERRHTGERPFTCKFCMKGFTENRSLIRHERLHTGEKPFICKYCGKAVTDQSTLTRHEHSHSEVKRFQCQYCEKRFTWHQHCMIHELLHTGEKPHSCGFCNKRFTKKANLTEHERIHTGAKPYKCCHCDKAFNQRGACRTHEHTHMGTKPYKCERCDKSFSWQHLLTKHEQSHYDVNAPLETDDVDEVFEKKRIKKLKVEQKNVEKRSEKKSSAGSNNKNLPVNRSYEQPAVAPGDLDKSFDRDIAVPHGTGPSLKARCNSLASTVNALHQSIVTALGQAPPGAPSMSILDPNARSSAPMGPVMSGMLGQDNRGVPMSQTSTHGQIMVSRGSRPDAAYRQSPHKSVVSPNAIPSYNEIMNLNSEKNSLTLPHMPRVMRSPTQMHREEDVPFIPPNHDMGSRTYAQLSQPQHVVTSPTYVQTQVEHMSSSRLGQGPSHEISHSSLQQQHEGYIQQQEHVMNDPAYEQVINNEVEVTDSGEQNVAVLHQQINSMMTAFNQNLDNSGSSFNTLSDNSNVIILSVPKR